MSRPDPSRGVLETIRVANGRAMFLAEHLARLRASVRELYGIELDTGAIAIPPLPDELQRLRIVVTPDGAVRAALAPPGTPDPLLAPWPLPGGLGAHKWADRRLVDGAAERLGATPLILDADGSVLEAAWANVWALEGERLVTPPTDGRLLPGVTRARLLRSEFDTAEEPLDLERLEAANVIVLTSAVQMAVAGRLQGTEGGDERRVAEIAEVLHRELDRPIT